MKNRIDKWRNTRRRVRSLTYVCTVHYLIVLFIGILIYASAALVVSHRMAVAYPRIDDVMRYRKGIRGDDWSEFSRSYPNSQLIVFDDHGTMLYSTDRDIEGWIQAEDLNLIEEADSEQYYRVVEYIGTELDPKYRYMVLKLHKNDEGNNDAEDYCVISDEGEVILGTMFGDRKTVSEHELMLLRGVIYGDIELTKYSYKNETGQNRTLVFAAKLMTTASYEALVTQMNWIWIGAVLLILADVIIGVLRLKSMIHRNLDPMVEEIRNCATGEYDPNMPPETMTEFRVIAQEVHRLVGRLEEAGEKQRKLERERRRVTASLSHDLKTPIAVIMGYTQAFQDGRIKEDDRSKYYDMLMDKSRLAVDMIDTMSEYAKMEHPDFRLEKDQVEICEFLRQYLMSVYDELTDHGVDLYPDIPEEEILVDIDRRLMIRVFNNLLSNTRKYNPDGVRLMISLCKEDHGLVIRVMDDGIGIDPELRDAIFHPFVTSNEARTSGQGTGLGLSIVEKIIIAHGGIIELVDAEEEGYTTEFRIFLPVT